MDYGGVVAANGSGANVFAATPAQLTGFTGNGESANAQAIIPDFANNRLLVEQGVYWVEGDFSFGIVGAGAANLKLALAKNGTAVPEIQGEFSTISLANTKLNVSFSGILTVGAADVSQQPYVGPAVPPSVPSVPPPVAQPPVAILTLLVSALAGGPQTLTLEYANFAALRLS